MIRKTEPNVLGVSRPRGMAVTSDRPVLPGQPKRHERIDQVADQDPDGRSRDHPGQNERPRHLEHQNQQARHQDHARRCCRASARRRR